ncbi:MAG TPA: hypothetical protein VJC00_04490 [Candidatus Nanoarchaeia archaeon]|nr:hypothetical protein [Candidatus Nanoarchaeia archaeon]
MSKKNIVTEVDNLVPVRNVLVSVSDKSDLEDFIPGLVEVCPGVKIYSTGGTYDMIKDNILKDQAKGMLFQVSDYTGQPETQGGLVKTLDFKIYLSILTEKYNADHQGDLQRTQAVPIDMVVCNLYPFSETVAKGATLEEARANIDIGGPTMIRAAAKNFLRVASVVNPGSYGFLIGHLASEKGCTELQARFDLAKKAFAHTAEYDRAISEHLKTIPLADVMKAYPIVHERGE